MFYVLIFLFCAISTIYCFEDFYISQNGIPFKSDAVPFQDDVKMVYIPQKLDNFNAENNETFLMRVQFNDEFHKPGGPIFVMIGGEYLFVNEWFEKGLFYEMAKENNAYMLYTEHRFYGGSLPARNFSLDYLKYLTPEQALADLVNTIRYYKSLETLSSSKVIVFGGSYAGNLALWARAKYPKEIQAAVSSSAPLKALFAFYDYHMVVRDVLGQQCSSYLYRSIQQILSHLGTPEGAKKVGDDFRMCANVDLTDPMEIMYLMSIISTHFGSIVQNKGPSIHKVVCNQLLFSNDDEYTTLVHYLDDVLGLKCRKGYNDYKEYIRTTNRGNIRQWMYQSCTQFGFFQTTDAYSNTEPFGNSLPIEMYQKWCTDFFGPELTYTDSQIGILKTNMVFGGLNPLVTKVVSVQGTGDPWHKLGLQEDLNCDAPVIIVNGTYHCQDLYPENETDTDELKNARIMVRHYIKKWLQDD